MPHCHLAHFHAVHPRISTASGSSISPAFPPMCSLPLCLDRYRRSFLQATPKSSTFALRPSCGSYRFASASIHHNSSIRTGEILRSPHTQAHFHVIRARTAPFPCFPCVLISILKSSASYNAQSAYRQCRTETGVEGLWMRTEPILATTTSLSTQVWH